MLELLAQSSAYNTSWTTGGIVGAIFALILLGGLLWSVVDALLTKRAYKQEDKRRQHRR